jgi:hypothetical protein
VPEVDKPPAKERMGRTVAATQNQHRPSSFEDHVKRVNDALTEEHGFYYAPAEMIRHAQVQLQYLHFSQSLPDLCNFRMVDLENSWQRTKTGVTTRMAVAGISGRLELT